jgi:HEAT repeat protein
MLEGVALAIQRGRPASDEFLPKARGFMRAGKNKTAEFVHELWQAYFAARALRQAPDLTPLSEHLAEPAWWDTALFYAGLGDASELVETLVARGNVFLAGNAIAHAQGVRAELRDAVTQELIHRAWEGDGNAIAALGEMNSDVAVDWFAKQLKDKDPAARTRAAEILGWLQLDRGIEYLLPQLRDVNADVRDKVVEALGRSRTDRVIEPLLVALRGDARVGTVDTRLRVAAAKALGQIASDKAVPALIVDLQLGEPEVRAVAAEALKRITSPLMSKPLQGVLQSGDEEGKKYAAEILALVDGKD